jgi:hypothetical protein
LTKIWFFKTNSWTSNKCIINENPLFFIGKGDGNHDWNWRGRELKNNTEMPLLGFVGIKVEYSNLEEYIEVIKLVL